MEHAKQIESANRRARQRRLRCSHALGAHFDPRTGRVVVHLSNRLDIAFDPSDVEGLQNASSADLSRIEISPSGLGLHFPAVDADIYIPALLEGILGSPRWMAGRLGQRGGRAKSPAKTAAARRNGKLGGRPRKKAAA